MIISTWRSLSNWHRLLWMLSCLTMGCSYAIITIAIPVLPQYLRENVYKFVIVVTDEHGKCPNSTASFSNKTVTSLTKVYPQEDIKNGALFAAYELAQILSQPLISYLITIFEALSLMLWLSPMLLTTSTLFAFGTSYFFLFGTRMMQGVAGAGVNTCIMSALSTAFTRRQRQQVMPVVVLFWGIGPTVLPAFAGMLYDAYGKTEAFLMMTCITAVLAGGWHSLRFVSKTKSINDERQPLVKENGTEVEDDHLDDTPVPYSKLLTDGPLLTLFALHVLSSVASSFQQPIISNRLHELDDKTTQTQVGALEAVKSIGGLISTWLITTFSEYAWYDNSRLMFVCQPFLAACLVAMAFAPTYLLFFPPVIVLYRGRHLRCTVFDRE